MHECMSDITAPQKRLVLIFIHLYYTPRKDMPSSDLDKAFELIEEGNELETKEEHWQASAKYSDACTLLNMELNFNMFT